MITIPVVKEGKDTSLEEFCVNSKIISELKGFIGVWGIIKIVYTTMNYYFIFFFQLNLD